LDVSILGAPAARQGASLVFQQETLLSTCATRRVAIAWAMEGRCVPTMDHRSITIATLAALCLATLALAGSIAARGAAARPLSPGATIWPISVGVNSKAEVYVGSADMNAGLIRLGADGAWLGTSRTDGPMDDLAVAPDDSVFMVMDKSNRVYRYLPDGTRVGMWQAGSHGIAIAVGPRAADGDSAVYVLWTPQRIGEPPSGPPRITRYSAEGEKRAEWEVGAGAYDLTVVSSTEAPEGIVHVADGGGSIRRYTADGAPLGDWPALAAEGRRIAAGPEGATYLVFQPAPGEPSQLWHYAADGQARLACSLSPGAAPRDIAVDPLRGEIYVLFPDFMLRLAPDCSLLTHFDRDQLRGGPAETPGTPGTSGTPGTPGTPQPTETPLRTSTPPGTPPPLYTPTPPSTATPSDTPTHLPEPPLPAEPPPMYFGIEGQSHEAAIGTYCWFPGGCMDAIGPITPAEPVRLRLPSTLRLDVSATLDIQSAELRAWPVRMEDAQPITVGRWAGELAWTRFAGPRIDLPVLPLREQALPLDLDPGLHILAFTVYWASRGDAVYGLLVEVERGGRLYLPGLSIGR
jgi:hypothetical protein